MPASPPSCDPPLGERLRHPPAHLQGFAWPPSAGAFYGATARLPVCAEPRRLRGSRGLSVHPGLGGCAPGGFPPEEPADWCWTLATPALSDSAIPRCPRALGCVPEDVPWATTHLDGHQIHVTVPGGPRLGRPAAVHRSTHQVKRGKATLPAPTPPTRSNAAKPLCLLRLHPSGQTRPSHAACSDSCIPSSKRGFVR